MVLKPPSYHCMRLQNQLPACFKTNPSFREVLREPSRKKRTKNSIFRREGITETGFLIRGPGPVENGVSSSTIPVQTKALALKLLIINSMKLVPQMQPHEILEDISCPTSFAKKKKKVFSFGVFFCEAFTSPLDHLKWSPQV